MTGGQYLDYNWNITFSKFDSKLENIFICFLSDKTGLSDQVVGRQQINLLQWSKFKNEIVLLKTYSYSNSYSLLKSDCVFV